MNYNKGDLCYTKVNGHLVKVRIVAYDEGNQQYLVTPLQSTTFKFTTVKQDELYKYSKTNYDVFCTSPLELAKILTLSLNCYDCPKHIQEQCDGECMEACLKFLNSPFEDTLEEDYMASRCKYGFLGYMKED